MNTPKRSKRKPQRKEDLDSESTCHTRTEYVPVVDLAPGSPLRLQGNLTGVPRKLKDLAADWHNAKLKWKKECQAGFLVCNKLGNIKLDSFVDGNSLPDSLLPLCDELFAVIQSLQRILDKMIRWMESVQGIKELLQSQDKMNNIIFQTWTIERFTRASVELHSMYQNEMKLKRNIHENICHSQTKSELMFMLACWSHEPYIDETTLLNIDAMVTETGHILVS